MKARFKAMIVAGALVAVSAGEAQAAWRRAESAHFVVYSEGGDGALRAYVDELEVFDGLLRREFGVRPDEAGSGKLTIYLVDGLGDLRRVWPDLQRSVTGFYSAGTDDIYAVASTGREAAHTIQHEYMHHFMLQHRPYPYPAWLVEGVAEYWATTDIARDAVTVGKFDRNRALGLANLPWLPLDVVLGRRPEELRDSQAQGMYYAQAWLLTHYLARDPKRRPQLLAYMTAVGEKGADPVKAMETATGMSVRALEDQLRRYFTGRIVSERYAVTGQRKTAPMTVSVMPPSADELLLESQALKRTLSPAEGAAMLAKVRAAAVRHGADRLARLALARAELAYGDRAAGDAALGAYLKTNLDDAEALTVLAESKLDAAEKDGARRNALHNEARRLLNRAYKAEPRRYQTIYALARARSNAPDYPTDADLETLAVAHELAPQVAAIRLQTAQVALRRNDRALAVRLLTPLVNGPHGGAEVERARALLAQARAQAPQ
ncbi:MAG: DUF1570 domain-containing protein [Proteobacteria bacterium]|nr:DUF1570 domain-containing protein [Pseudomonadota bacterium]